MYLLADIGGTNTRIALGDVSGLIDGARQSYANDSVSDFYAALDDFLSRHPETKTIKAACVAIAGPVTGRTARLTNRDWTIDADMLEYRFGIDRAQIINDLSALGYAVHHLPPSGVSTLRAPSTQHSGNGQRIVAGVGTGFNISPVLSGGERPIVMLAEMGHASIPASMLPDLRATLGDKAAAFTTVEQCLSGLGLAAMYRARTGRSLAGHQIWAAAEQDADARAVVDLMARLLGVFLKELTYQFMPMSGIYLAGSVSRALSEPTQLSKVLAAYDASTGRLDASLPIVPIHLITDDAAALIGCHAVAVTP